MAKHTMQELKMRQKLPLEVKILMTKQRIREWIDEFGEDGVYISFSGGKDSTVLLHLVRQINPNIPAVFVDTGLEYPEIREFVKGFENVTWLKPELTFKQVIELKGYPFISKEVSHKVQCVRNVPDGKMTKYFDGSQKGSKYNCEKWKFMLDSPFKISRDCCDVMKKKPIHKYEKQTGRHAHFTGMMAEESKFRESMWLRNGCNAFESKHPASNPMSFWTEQDVLNYIRINHIQIASVYGNIEIDYEALEQAQGQVTINDVLGLPETFPLRTTGCSRTGCMFCGFGCHLNNDQRFVTMKKTHPKQYDYIMRPASQGGLNYKEVIDWLNEHGNLNIKY